MNEIYVTGRVGSEAGFYIGDPGYVLRDGIYDWWGDVLGFRDGRVDTPVGSFCVAGTAYGDGTYYDSRMETGFDVDSGTLALIPMEIVTGPQGEGRDRALACGKVIDVPGEAVLIRGIDGTFEFIVHGDDGAEVTVIVPTCDMGDDDDMDDDGEDGE